MGALGAAAPAWRRDAALALAFASICGWMSSSGFCFVVNSSWGEPLAWLDVVTTLSFTRGPPLLFRFGRVWWLCLVIWGVLRLEIYGEPKFEKTLEAQQVPLLQRHDCKTQRGHTAWISTLAKHRRVLRALRMSLEKGAGLASGPS